MIQVRKAKRSGIGDPNVGLIFEGRKKKKITTQEKKAPIMGK